MFALTATMSLAENLLRVKSFGTCYRLAYIVKIGVLTPDNGPHHHIHLWQDRCFTGSSNFCNPYHSNIRPTPLIVRPSPTPANKYSAWITLIYERDSIIPAGISLQLELEDVPSYAPGRICKDCGDVPDDISLQMYFGNCRPNNSPNNFALYLSGGNRHLNSYFVNYGFNHNKNRNSNNRDYRSN
jgi:hypothetical protein